MANLLTEKLQSVFKTLRGYGKLSESNVSDAVREVRLALLAADVNYQVAREFCDEVKKKSLGAEVLSSIRPGDQFVKIVHDELLARFGTDRGGLTNNRPLRILLCGLNGAGKTTTAAKLARWYKEQRKEHVVLVAGDLARPAAIQQLQTLGAQIGVNVLAWPDEKDPVKTARMAREEAERLRAEVIIFDSAGRTDVDDQLLGELENVARAWEPQETLLVADAATGQTAVKVAQAFQTRVPLTGLILSKFDADVRGGAALSFHAVTSSPIRFLGTGEGVKAFEQFMPERLVSRLLGMGDIIGLVEVAQEQYDAESASKIEEKLRKNSFDLQDFVDQMRQMKKLGPLENLLGMIPGMANLKVSPGDEKSMGRIEAMILSMTPAERRNPDLLNARRRLRIANGSGTSVTELNQLLRRFGEMKKLMGRFTRGGKPEKMLQQWLGQQR
jgi:signal recognition particle subunit SRP54